MRIVFMGTPEFAVPVLDALSAAGHEVIAAYTQPPRPGGRRGRELVASPVQRRAEALGIEVRSPARLRGEEEQAAFAAFGADVAVVAAYGLILPPPILAAPRHGCLNVHASLLPRWRGAAPVQRAILAGDAETGVCIMRMEAGLDTGPVLIEGRVAVGAKNAGELTEELARLGAALMVEALADLPSGVATPQPDAGVTYAAKIDKAEARLDFTRSAEEVERQVRAFAPAPGAWFEVRGERVKVLAATPVRHPGESRDRSDEGAPDAATDPGLRWGDGVGRVLDDHLTVACAANSALRPTHVQRAGRGIATAAELLRGFPIPPGTKLGRWRARVTRFALTIDYDGRPFMGWQRQAHGPSVQQAVEAAVASITGETPGVHAAGRTDAGVHALAMRAHVDIERPITPFRLMEALNARLRPAPVAVLACEAVADDWHARFSCLGRAYEYRIVNRRAPLTREAGLAWRMPRPLDEVAMAAAARELIGRHDFTTFRSAHCQADSPLRTLDRLDVARDGERLTIRAEARSFLHHQVRSMVGCLALVGIGRWSAADLAAALAARDRAALGLHAPPDGLYFIAARYPGRVNRAANSTCVDQVNCPTG